jgi:hypothetical protein
MTPVEMRARMNSPASGPGSTSGFVEEDGVLIVALRIHTRLNLEASPLSVANGKKKYDIYNTQRPSQNYPKTKIISVNR